MSISSPMNIKNSRNQILGEILVTSIHQKIYIRETKPTINNPVHMYSHVKVNEMDLYSDSSQYRF